MLLTLIWVDFLGVLFKVGREGGVKITPSPQHVQNSLELCSKLEIWYVSRHTYAVSENIPFSTKTFLILQMSSFFFFFAKNQRFLANIVSLLKAIV